MMNIWHDIAPERIKSDDFVACIEISKGGKNKYEMICVSCHGPEGKGMQALGAPDLTDDYWLYGEDSLAVQTSIGKGRNGMMPAHTPIIGETRVRLAAAYVWSLSQPQTAKADTGKMTQ